MADNSDIPEGIDPNKTIDRYVNDLLLALAREEASMASDARFMGKRLIDNRKKRKGESQWQNKGGSLVVMVRERGVNSDSLTFTWATLTPLLISGDYKTQRRHIPKGRGMSYPRTTLLKHARPWEQEDILTTEEMLTELRRRAKKIALCRRSLRDYMKATGLDDLLPETY